MLATFKCKFGSQQLRSSTFRKSRGILTHHSAAVIIVGHRCVRKFYSVDVNLSMKLTLMLEYTILSCCATAAFSVEFLIKSLFQTCFRAAVSWRRPLYDCHCPPSGPFRYDECCGMWNVDIACTRTLCGCGARPFQFNVQRVPKVINDEIYVRQVSCDESDDFDEEGCATKVSVLNLFTP